ncbi:hypothetical protein V6N13_065756 [Hibiscus sabdariffa]|uniref:Uncharacterized protein n=1 Tax=Hibiscus sabdariffa TaxID=183260 RepID=A0ABR2QQ78_9ROSI
MVASGTKAPLIRVPITLVEEDERLVVPPTPATKTTIFIENMSNLTWTSASGEASVFSGNRIEADYNYPQRYFTAQQPEAQPVKRMGNLPENSGLVFGSSAFILTPFFFKNLL